jgi:hypothetical protein
MLLRLIVVVNYERVTPLSSLKSEERSMTFARHIGKQMVKEAVGLQDILPYLVGAGGGGLLGYLTGDDDNRGTSSLLGALGGLGLGHGYKHLGGLEGIKNRYNEYMNPRGGAAPAAKPAAEPKAETTPDVAIPAQPAGAPEGGPAGGTPPSAAGVPLTGDVPQPKGAPPAAPQVTQIPAKPAGAPEGGQAGGTPPSAAGVPLTGDVPQQPAGAPPAAPVEAINQQIRNSAKAKMQQSLAQDQKLRRDQMYREKGLIGGGMQDAGQAVNRVSEAAGDAVDTVGRGINQAGQTVVDTGLAAARKAQDVGRTTVQGVQEGARRAGNYAGNVGRAVGNEWNSAGDSLTDVLFRKPMDTWFGEGTLNNILAPKVKTPLNTARPPQRKPVQRMQGPMPNGQTVDSVRR